MYVPTLAREILNRGNGKYNLKGYAVGDACTGTEVLCGGDNNFGPYFYIQFFYGHGQFSNKLYDEIMETCTIEELKYNPQTPQCRALVDKISSEVGGYYDYNL